MKQFLSFVLVLAIAGAAVYYFFPDLFADVPSVGMAEKAVSERVVGPSKGVEVDLFQKTDGQERTDESGVRHYALDYKCVAKFSRDAMWALAGSRFETAVPLSKDASRRERREAEKTLAGKKLAKSGDTVALKGTVDFVSKESGWVVTSVTIALDR
jgi:hypothetical protein